MTNMRLVKPNNKQTAAANGVIEILSMCNLTVYEVIAILTQIAGRSAAAHPDPDLAMETARKNLQVGFDDAVEQLKTMKGRPQ